MLVVGATTWWLPAGWASPWLAHAVPGLRLQQLRGTIWNGRAERVLATDGTMVGRAQWRISRMALLGRSQLWLSVTGPRLDVRGEMRRMAGDRVEWRDVTAWIDLALLANPRWHLLPPGTRGEVSLQSDRMQLQGGWPRDGQAALVWCDAAWPTRVGAVMFGRLDARLDARNGVISAQWHDAGDGPLHTAGTLDASVIGWRIQATLQPRSDDPRLRRWLALLGKPDASGTLHLERRGGLAAASRLEKPAP